MFIWTFSTLFFHPEHHLGATIFFWDVNLTGGSKPPQVLAKKSSIQAKTEKIFSFCMDNGVTKFARRKKSNDFVHLCNGLFDQKLHTNLIPNESLTSLLSIPIIFTDIHWELTTLFTNWWLTSVKLRYSRRWSSKKHNHKSSK
jgi:hypothetical protein